MFDIGDDIILVDGTTPYTVMRSTSEWYELMSHDYMHMCQRHSRKFVDENFVLVGKFNEKEKEDEEDG